MSGTVHHTLQKTFAAQAGFQRYIGAHPDDLALDIEKIQYIKDMVLAAEDELHELLQEIGWKPWATSRHINIDAVKSELVDTFQFFMNLCLAVGLTPAELMGLHEDKLKKNYERADAGYDGVSTKCAWCKRALDDDAVSCEVSVEGTTHAYCAAKAIVNGDGFFTEKDLRDRR